MAWRPFGTKPLSKAMLTQDLSHICVIRPQCVKDLKALFSSDSETLKQLAKFAKLIMSAFKKQQPTRDQVGPETKRIRVSRTGRKIVSPNRLNI